MNIIKKILTITSLFLGITMQAAEHVSKKTSLREAVDVHLSRDTAGIVEKYVTYDGTIALDPTRGVTYEEFDDGYCIPVTYTHTQPPTTFLASTVLEKLLVNRVAGDTIELPYYRRKNGEPYVFILAENKDANLKKIAGWRRDIISKALAHKGFTGEHAQMVRFMLNTAFFSYRMDGVAVLQQKDPSTLSEDDKFVLGLWNEDLDIVVHGKKKDD